MTMAVRSGYLHTCKFGDEPKAGLGRLLGYPLLAVDPNDAPCSDVSQKGGTA